MLLREAVQCMASSLDGMCDVVMHACSCSHALWLAWLWNAVVSLKGAGDLSQAALHTHVWKIRP